jgi:hypothetical protein
VPVSGDLRLKTFLEKYGSPEALASGAVSRSIVYFDSLRVKCVYNHSIKEFFSY